MKVLGIDTSGYANAIGIVDDGQVLADSIFEARTDSLQKIILHIDAVLKQANLTLKDIEGFGVGLGPGSWTGIRIGVTVGKMLAYSMSKPVAGVPTLAILAHSADSTSWLVCPIISAGTQKMVYAAFYHLQDDALITDDEYFVGDIANLAARVDEPTVFVGAGAPYYAEQIAGFIGAQNAVKAVEAVPRGAIAALLAADRFKRAESDSALSLSPLYLKESTARAFIRRQTSV